MRIAAVIALLVAVGCGAGSSAPAAGSSSPTDLKISYWPEGTAEGTVEKWTLRCSPAGGTLPRALAVCRKLGTMQAPFAPIPKDVVCTDQYGGPQVALFTGTFRGKRLWARVENRNGCEIARFKRLSFLVPAFGAGSDA
jgi:hypothetical protein